MGFPAHTMPMSTDRDDGRSGEHRVSRGYARTCARRSNSTVAAVYDRRQSVYSTPSAVIDRRYSAVLFLRPTLCAEPGGTTPSEVETTNPRLPFSFKIEKMLLPPEASPVASEFPILINDAMAREHDRNCRTRRTAEDSGCPHAQEKDAVVRRVLPHICALHLLDGRHRVHDRIVPLLAARVPPIF